MPSKLATKHRARLVVNSVSDLLRANSDGASHLPAGNSTFAMIEALDPNLIQIFHINDAEDLPRAELEDRHRLLPGLGILPLQNMIAAFRKIGYDKVASVEIFRPEYWERDPFELARDAHAATERVMAEA